MGETRDHLEEHGEQGRFYCFKQCEYYASRCQNCPDNGAQCPEWVEEAPAPDDEAEARAMAGEAKRILQNENSSARYIDHVLDLLALPAENPKRGHVPVLLQHLRRRIISTEESCARLYDEVERLKPIAEAMKLVEQISDQRRQIAHLQSEIARITGIAEAASSVAVSYATDAVRGRQLSDGLGYIREGK